METEDKATETGEPKNGNFAQTYTQNEQGFFVRNEKPSSSPLNEDRVKSILRSLLQEVDTKG